MLLSLVIRMRATSPGVLPANQGRALNDTFLGWVEEFEAGLSARLHDAGGRKPFTVSDLQGGRFNQRGEVLYPAGQETWWRVTSLSDDLSALLEKAIIPAVRQRRLEEPVCLGGKVPFQVLDIITDAAGHAWAGRTTCEELYDFHEKGEPSDSVEIQFASPTTFHSAGKHLPFPLPELVLGSWLEQWNNISGVRLLEDIRLFGRASVAASRYDLHTQVVHYDKETLIGFCGGCTFRMLSKEGHWLRLVNLLAAFAFYCGTGAKTAFGLGQTRLIK